MTSETLMTPAAEEQTADASPSVETPATAAGVEGQQPAPAEAPAVYEFAPIEGVPVAPPVIEAYTAAARELKLSPEAAQTVLQRVAPVIQNHHTAMLNEAVKNWEAEVRADPEYGGDKLDATLANAQKVLKDFGDPGLAQLLQTSGLGNHPALVRTFAKIGAAFGGDSFIPGKNGADTIHKDARSLYSNTPMNP